MTLYIKQKIFSIGDKYDILDAYQNPVYTAEGEVFSFGNKVHLYNSHGEELFFIKQVLLTFMPKFEIYHGGNLFATLNKEFTFFYKKINVESSFGSFVIDGNFFDHDYTITCNGKLFGTVQKQWLTWGDVYALDINSNEHSEFFVALVLAIDCILEMEKNR
ncbi:MAG: LURP-one-related family protein [Clostridia bacterium]